MHRKHLKKTTAAFLSLMITASAVLSAENSQVISAGNIPGDVSGDSRIASDDLVIFRNYMFGNQLSPQQTGNADINSDGRINISDYILLKNMILTGNQGNSNVSSRDYSALKINEVCTSNKSGLQDTQGSHPDWIEIINSSSSGIDVSGVGLSDGSKNRYKFVFPQDTVINANSSVIVLCDDTDVSSSGEYHAPFKLSSAGETIYLTAPSPSERTNGNDIDILEIPELPEDVTYGRYPDGSDSFSYLQPSPGKNNSSSQTVYLIEKPVFGNSEFSVISLNFRVIK